MLGRARLLTWRRPSPARRSRTRSPRLSAQRAAPRPWWAVCRPPPPPPIRHIARTAGRGGQERVPLGPRASTSSALSHPTSSRFPQCSSVSDGRHAPQQAREDGEACFCLQNHTFFFLKYHLSFAIIKRRKFFFNLYLNPQIINFLKKTCGLLPKHITSYTPRSTCQLSAILMEFHIVGRL